MSEESAHLFQLPADTAFDGGPGGESIDSTPKVALEFDDHGQRPLGVESVEPSPLPPGDVGGLFWTPFEI